MKTLKKLLPMLLACTFAFSACVGGTPTTSTGGDSSVDSSSTGGNTSVEVQDNVIINGTTPNITPSNPQKEKEEHFQTENVLHKVNVTETDRPFIVNRKSEYKVLLPANASPDIKTAAAYFVKYVSQATGYYLPTESADSYTWDEDAKWIVFGRTELFQAAGLTMPVDDIGQSGYYIKSAGDSVFLAVKEDLSSEEEEGSYAGINAYIPRTDHPLDEVFVFNEEVKKLMGNLWSKVKIAASNAK